MDDCSESRREFVMKTAYVAPAILTLVAAPAFAKSGSQKDGKRKHGDDDDQGSKRPTDPRGDD